MTDAIQTGRAKDARARLDGARAFSRLMIWVCLTLSVGIAALVVCTAAAVVIGRTQVTTSGSTEHFDLQAGPKHVDRPYILSFSWPTITTTVTKTATTTRSSDGTVRTAVKPTPILRAPPGFDPNDIMLWLTTMLPLLLAAALWQAAGFFRRLFRGYALSAPTVRSLRNFSVFGVVFLAADSLLEPAANALLRLFGDWSVRISPSYLTYGLPADRATWILSGSNLMLIIFAAVLVAMVSVLARAAAIAEDHAQIV